MPKYVDQFPTMEDAYDLFIKQMGGSINKKSL